MSCEPVGAQFNQTKHKICTEQWSAQLSLNVSLLALLFLMMLNFSASLFLVSWNSPFN